MSDFSEGKPLVRRREGRVLAGVCAGLAVHFGLDVTLVRLVFAALSIFGGMGILLYLVAWMVIPEEGEQASIVESFVTKKRGS